MTQRHLILAAGLAGAAWLAFFGDTTADAGIAEPITRAATPAGSGAPARVRQAAPATTILALEPRDTLIGGASSAGGDGQLFGTHTWTPPAPPPLPPKPQPPSPPAAPALPFTYLGKKGEDGVWEVFLARGEQTYIVRAQTVIDGTYRVESIRPPTLALTYLPLNQMQTLPIGGTD